MRYLLLTCFLFGNVNAKFEINVIGNPPKPVISNNYEIKVKGDDIATTHKNIGDAAVVNEADTLVKINEPLNLPVKKIESNNSFIPLSKRIVVNNISKLDFVHKLNSGNYPTGNNFVAQYGAYGDPVNARRFYKRIKSIVPEAVLIGPSSKNNLTLNYIVVGLPGTDVKSEVSYLNRQIGLEASIKKITYHEFKSNISHLDSQTQLKHVIGPIEKIKTSSSQNIIKPIVSMDKSIKSGNSFNSERPEPVDKLLKETTKAYQVSEGRTLISTFKEWLPGTSIEFADSSSWIKNIVFDSHVDCGHDKDAAVLKIQKMINNNPAMMKRKIHVLFKLTNNKLEISHES